ncbi:DUF554 domain-containing protein [Petroclostridium sp. X23]|uniref:DUF554 domain-containing protein n=1 Tax=Petroclostridium sp. X23 TaxID=3045146 RepID=UPI0024AE6D29|nr:DUF554 domain-containing protein [Petroclostridium sp. X23]WHH60946.1 DUF554 domain-containing protein [Petroclostridium sp. X23]
MPIGIILNSLAVFFGGLLGAFLGNKIPERIRTALPLTFGAAAMAMGVIYIGKVNTLSAVVLSLILGSVIGELIKLEERIEWCAHRIRKPIERLFPTKGNIDNQDEFMEKFVAIVVIFCVSGTGIFGALTEGITGDHSILVTKALLDLFTAGIFAAALGYIVMTICIPQFIIMICLFFSASFILPMITSEMIADFMALGGIIMLATGFRISGIKAFPIGNMLPAVLIVMPVSYLWTAFIV